MKDAFTLAAARPWYMQREALEQLLMIADRQGSLDALETKRGQALDRTENVRMREGVALVRVRGPIFRYANLFTDISGATSTASIARDFQTALDNPYVRAIVLDVDSPGGEAAGIRELAATIAAGRGKKPIKAYVGSTAASAGYWIASAAEEIVVDETAILGSIGVVMSYLDTAERDAKSGVRRVEIVSSQSPDKRIDPGTDAGRAKVQETVDALAQVFVEQVASNRGVSVDTVLSDFGQGGVRVGKAAIKAGMADRLGTLEALITELAGPASTTQRKTPMSNTNKGQVTVATTEDLRAAMAAGYTAEQIHIANASQSALDTARAAGVEEGRKSASDEAAKSERARIAKLQGLARAGFEKELAAAIDSGATPEAFALSLLEAAKDRGITLDSIAKDSPPAASHAKPGADTPQKPTCASASDILARRRNAITSNAA